MQQFFCHVLFTPVLGKQDYYFDIEKVIFVDRNLHERDDAQKFVFKVERFSESDADLNAPVDCFYVTLNCTEPLSSYPNTGNLSAFAGHSYDPGDSSVTISYPDGSYTFPAALRRGVVTVRVDVKGIYRVEEVSGWSSTDYDFWTGSNVYRGFAGGGEAVPNHNAVKMLVGDDNADYDRSVAENRPTASFTNTETEYAFLSSQAYAGNTLVRPGS